MSIFGKIAFWKRDELALNDDLGLPKGAMQGDDLGMNSGMQGMPPMQQMPMGAPRMESFENMRSYNPTYQQPNRDLEVVSAKLDAVKATLDSINQRIANLERIAYGEDEQPARRRGW